MIFGKNWSMLRPNMKRSIALQSESPDVLSMRNFPEGPFLCLLASLRTDTLEFEVSELISVEYQEAYLDGLDIYLNWCNDQPCDLASLTEERLFAMAVIALEYRDVSPIQRMISHVTNLDTKYYWIHLSETPELFFSLVEVEAYRRRFIKKLELVDLSRDNKLGWEYINVHHMPYRDTVPFLRDPRSFVDRRDISREFHQNPRDGFDSLPLSTKELAFVNKILDLGLVIGGSFVDCCINRKHSLTRVDNLMLTRIYSTYLEYHESNEDVEKFADFFIDEFGSTLTPTESMKLARHIGVFGFYDYIVPGSIISSMFMTRVGDYLFYQHASEFTKYVATIGDDIFFKTLLLGDADVFTVGTREIGEVLDFLQESKFDGRIIHGESYCGIDFGSRIFRLIKFEYSSIEDVVCSMDLDCEQVVMKRWKKREVCFLSTKSYVDCSTRGICVVNPSNQNDNYVDTLLAAKTERNYFLYLPKQVMVIHKRMSEEELQEYDRHLEYPLRSDEFNTRFFSRNYKRYLTQREACAALTEVASDFRNYPEDKTEAFNVFHQLHMVAAFSFWLKVDPHLPVPFLYYRSVDPHFFSTMIAASIDMELVLHGEEEEENKDEEELEDLEQTEARMNEEFKEILGLITSGIMPQDSDKEEQRYDVKSVVELIRGYLANEIEYVYSVALEARLLCLELEAG